MEDIKIAADLHPRYVPLPGDELASEAFIYFMKQIDHRLYVFAEKCGRDYQAVYVDMETRVGGLHSQTLSK